MKIFRFSCFPAHIPSHKHKKTVRVSGEGMKKVLEDSSQNKIMSEISGLVAESMPYKEEVLPNKSTESVTNCPPVELESKSDDLDGDHNVNCDIMALKTGTLRKSISLGSVLNWEERSVIVDGAEEEVEQRLSDNVSVDQSGVAVPDGVHVHAPDVSDKYQEPVASDSLHVGSDFTKNMSVFSIGGTQLIEKEDADKGDVGSPFVVDFSSPATQARSVIVRSSSLPKMGSPNQSSVFFLPHSRSAEDLSASESKKTSIRREFGLQMNFEETEKLHDENLVDDTDENYNFVDSAKHWIVPEHDVANTEMVAMGDTCSVQPWSEAPTGDFKLKRLEQWVTNLQYTGPLDETVEPAPSSDHQKLSKVDTSLEKTVVAKLDVSVTPGSEVAKRYISSLNASTTTAQLSNLGLVVIPLLSAFVGLKALNLSGNAIVRIAAGALPRGLHILNISKNSISIIEGLRNLTRLRVLDLSYNRILRIGHGLAGCSSLKELYLAGNKISEVEGLHRLLKLNVLDLRFNKISTTKGLDQLAANYNCLHALSLEGNPAQKNIGDEHLKKHLVSLLPNLTYYNRQPTKVGTMKDVTDRSARLGISSHQMDRSARVEVKNMRKGTAGRRVVPAKSGSSSKQVRPHPTVMRSSQQHPLSIFKNEISFPRSRSEGNLGVL